MCSACNRSAKSCAPAISSYNPSRKKARQLKHSTQRKMFNRILAVFLLIFEIPFLVTRYTLIIAKNDLLVKSYFKLVPAVFQERPYNASHPPLRGRHYNYPKRAEKMSPPRWGGGTAAERYFKAICFEMREAIAVGEICHTDALSPLQIYKSRSLNDFCFGFFIFLT